MSLSTFFNIQNGVELTPLIQALIAASVVIIGYYFNARANRNFEKFKMKIEAYTKFENAFESALPSEDGKTLDNEEKMRELNMALSELALKAPGYIMKEIKYNIFSGADDVMFGRSHFIKLQQIFQKDLHALIWNWKFWNWWQIGGLNEKYFMYVGKSPDKTEENKNNYK